MTIFSAVNEKVRAGLHDERRDDQASMRRLRRLIILLKRGFLGPGVDSG
jgi:hypothetical protein